MLYVISSNFKAMPAFGNNCFKIPFLLEISDGPFVEILFMSTIFCLLPCDFYLWFFIQFGAIHTDNSKN